MQHVANWVLLCYLDFIVFCRRQCGLYHVLKTFSLKWAELKIPLFPLCMLEIFVCTMTSSPCLREHHYTHTHTDVHTNCLGTLHADRYLTQYFWESLTGHVKMPMIGLKMPCPSSQPMSLSLISNQNIFSLVSYTMQRSSVSQTSAFYRRFIHCNPTKIGASLHWNTSFFAKNSTF